MEKYIEAVGRRKTATARVRLVKTAKKGGFKINDRDSHDYFKTSELLSIIESPFVNSEIPNKYSISVVVTGSGIHSQAEAIRHGITRALVKEDKELRSTLKKLGYLKRDPRKKERKKPGLKKARKAPTWSKR